MTVVDPAFEGVGQSSGLEIWRIENFEVKALPKSEYGNFYCGDSYIVLNTKETKSGRLEWDIHFWLGEETSQDEAGTSAIKSVELDDALGGGPVQHREVQGHESPLFLSYFKRGIRYLKGGVKSGFRHVVEGGEAPKRLLRVKGRRNVRLVEVELGPGSLCRGDCFVLDAGASGVWVLVGPRSGRMERIKAVQAANAIRDDVHCGRSTTKIVDENSSGGEVSEFFEELGGGSLEEVPEGGEEDDITFEASFEAKTLLYKIWENDSGELEVELVSGKPLQQDYLDSNDCFLLDGGLNGLFVWIGKNSSSKERKEAMNLASKYIEKNGYPKWLHCKRIVQGAEPPLFKSYFSLWKEPSDAAVDFGHGYSCEAPSGESEEKVIKRRSLHAKSGGSAGSFMPDDATGEVEIWRVENFDLVPVEPSQKGIFFGGDSYVLKYTYQNPGFSYILYFWQGLASSQDEKATAAIMTVKMDNEIGGRATQVRVVQGQEPEHFLRLFRGQMVTLSGGRASGFKNIHDHDSYDTDGTRLFQVRGTNDHNTRAEQVPETSSSLNSDDVFILETPASTFLWIGKSSSEEEQAMGRQIVGIVSPGRGCEEVLEGEEPEAFWSGLGGRGEYPSSRDLPSRPRLEPRLFKVSNASGRVRMEEVCNFDQEDLSEDDVMILDAGDAVYIWIGNGADEEEKSESLKRAEAYIQSDPTDRSSESTVLITVKQGAEPDAFKYFFSADWNPQLWQVLNAYASAKKLDAPHSPSMNFQPLTWTPISGMNHPTSGGPQVSPEKARPLNSARQQLGHSAKSVLNAYASAKKLDASHSPSMNFQPLTWTPISGMNHPTSGGPQVSPEKARPLNSARQQLGHSAKSDPATRKRVKSVLVAVVVSVLILTVVLVAVLAPKKDPRWKVVPGGPDRIECPGFTTGEECTSHGCSFEVASRGPNCVFPKDGGGGYSLRQVRMPSEDVTLMALTSRSPNTPYGPAIQNVTFQVTHLTENILRIKLLDADHARYEVPVEFPLLEDPPSSTPPSVYEVRTTTESGNPFSFQVVRKEDGTVLWDSSIAGGLSLSDQFVQVAGFLPQHSKVYGLGEHVHTTLQRDMEYRTWPIFARDRFPKEGAEINLYGAHPFYTCLETNSSKSHGVLFLNSNAMEVTLLPAPAISFRSTGGIVDLFFFVGEGPEHVVQLYTQLVGRPMMPPLWGLGFQLARYGYNNLDNVIKVVNRTRNAGIAQAVQYLDIDHMARNRDFSFDQERFKGLIDFMQKTKSEYGLRWIIIVDPAIEAAKGYPLYEDGVRKGVFVKRPRWWSPEVFPEEVRNEEFVYGKVWPEGLVAFPDFFLPATQEWWIEAITNYHKEMPFDGIWIDMNEPSNFGTNEDRPFYCPGEKCWSLKCPPSKLEDPPYNPLRSSGSDRLSTMTLCMESIQGERNYSHYDIHSLYGWSETLPTLRGAQAATGTRSLVISRSTFPSSGRHAGHWLGDNESTWPQMRASIIGMLEFNMFGIPYIGADVCGFGLETTEELCSRWMQLGAFYPYFRNHNGMGLKDQDPAALGPNVARVSVAAVRRRHQLLPYLYTLFHRAHTEGSTVVRPLFHEFPSDPVAQDPLTQEQFMWGRCLLISPILRQGEKTVQVYLPQEADWWLFDFNNTQLEIPGESIVERGDPEDLIPVHVRSGCIIPAQPPYTLPNPPSNSSNSTGELELYVFLDSNGEASGEVFLDDGESKDTYEQDQYSLFKFTFKNCTLEVEREGGGGGGGEELPLVRDVFVFVKRRNDEGSGSYYRSVHLLIQGDKRIDEMVGTTSIKLDECQPAPA